MSLPQFDAMGQIASLGDSVLYAEDDELHQGVVISCANGRLIVDGPTINMAFPRQSRTVVRLGSSRKPSTAYVVVEEEELWKAGIRP